LDELKFFELIENIKDKRREKKQKRTNFNLLNANREMQYRGWM